MIVSVDELVRDTRVGLEQAADAILSAAERGLELIGKARGGGRPPMDELEQLFHTILEACAFEDIANQRLSRLAAGGVQVIHQPDPLLAGPQLRRGLDQSAADQVFGAAPSAPLAVARSGD